MNGEKLKEILINHELWLRTIDGNVSKGKRAVLESADLKGAVLRGANLESANLRYANLKSADLSGAVLVSADLRDADLVGADLEGADLRGANLDSADLSGANLKYANLSGADLNGANLRGADLRHADLRYADLVGADLDYSVLPLGRGSLKANMDDRQTIQLLYHVLSIVKNSSNVSNRLKELLLTDENIKIANNFHRMLEYGFLKKEEVESND